ncbi:hypothetical protein KBX31_10550 [Liquorilactobacillus satsumensis]|uniref:pyocin knob domain-containing protein n=1 Tax=Lactobacillaceae TaxID=33958 RepID=UPI0021C3E461|nr:pyocin knob domain-containing protein [Liquorilactobacillus satsumensis]MCP9313708.1 hypothetical protein [Liquorilactobacillus satsumensis]MCP9360849.1 hypothetical protein [Liquorilactobacillus satsumensis]
MSDIQTQLQDDAGNNVLPKTVTAAITDLPDFASQIKAVSDTANGKMDVNDGVKLNATYISGSTDWNTVTDQGIHIVSCSQVGAGTHWPGLNNAASTNGDYGVALIFGDFNSLGIQVFFSYQGFMIMRAHNGGGWTTWNKANMTTAA